MIFNNIYFYILAVFLAPLTGKLIRTIYIYHQKKKEYHKENSLLSSLYRLTQREFEIWVCEYLDYIGFMNISLYPPKLDVAKNITCEKDDVTYFVECKKYFSNEHVSSTDMEALLGSMIINNINNGIIVTTSFLDDKTKKLLKSIPDEYSISIIDGNELNSLSIEQ